MSIAVSMGALCAMAVPPAAAETTARAGEGQRVVILVPGQQAVPGTSSRDQFDDMAGELIDAGYVVHTAGVNGLDLVADTAAVQKAVDDATAGADVTSLSIVAHSYGGLSSRNYLKSFGGADVIDAYVAIGTPQYGSPGGCVQLPGQGFDGCPVTPFIAGLNTGDDTPGDTDYVSIRSDEEFADGRLDGGQCRIAPIKDLAHEIEPADPRVIMAVVGALTGDCAGEFIDESDGDVTLQNSLFPAPTAR